jgi:hypothetical protein
MYFNHLLPSNPHTLNELATTPPIPSMVLNIVLMASYGKENVFTTSQILQIWNTRLSKRNETHKHDSDPINKLDLSIAISLDGPLTKSTPDAPVLLCIIASLPGGIRHENLEAIVPRSSIPDVNDVVAVREYHG